MIWMGEDQHRVAWSTAGRRGFGREMPALFRWIEEGQQK